MKVVYFGDQGQVYLDRIEYTGYTTNGLESGSTIAPTNTIRFYLESRPDAPDMYQTNYRIRTAYRLKTIDVLSNGSRVRTYKLSFTTSGSTSHSLLSTVQQFGKDATLDGTGTVVGGTSLPSHSVDWQGVGPTTFNALTYTYSPPTDFGANYNVWNIITGDFNGDGKTDFMRVGATSAHPFISNGDGNFTEL